MSLINEVMTGSNVLEFCVNEFLNISRNNERGTRWKYRSTSVGAHFRRRSQTQRDSHQQHGSFRRQRKSAIHHHSRASALSTQHSTN